MRRVFSHRSAKCAVHVALTFPGLVAAQVADAAPGPAPEPAASEALRRVYAWVDSYQAPVESAYLELRQTLTETIAGPEIDRLIHETEDPYLPRSQSRSELRRAIQQAFERPIQGEVLIAFDGRRYMYQRTQPYRINFSDPGAMPGLSTEAIYQDGAVNWHVYDETESAVRRTGTVPPGDLSPSLAGGRWGRYDIFLGGGGLVDLLRNLTGLAPVAAEGGLEWHRLQSEDAVSPAYISYDPRADLQRQPLRDLVLLPFTGGGCRIFHFQEWGTYDGRLRPACVVFSEYPPDVAYDPRAHAQFLRANRPSMSMELSVVRLEFDAELDPSIFAYTPPSGYQVTDFDEMSRRLATGSSSALGGESSAALPGPDESDRPPLEMPRTAPQGIAPLAAVIGAILALIALCAAHIVTRARSKTR